MQTLEDLQSLLDDIATCSAEKLPYFIYGYSKCSPAEQEGLITMMSFLRAPSRDLRMTVWEACHSGRFTMVVAFLRWPQGKEAAGVRPIIVCGEPGHEQVVGYVPPFNEIYKNFGQDKMQEVMKLTKWWIASQPRFREGKT